MVVAADTNAIAGKSAVEQIRKDGGRAIFVPTDVSEERDVIALLETALAEFGRIDVLYNNAAVLFHDQDARAHELSLEIWDKVMRVNLQGTFLCCKHVIPFMLKQGGGSIINLGSPTGLTGCAPNLTAYSTSKAGIFGLTKVMAAAYARDGIRVNSLIPGTMDTPMNESCWVMKLRVSNIGKLCPWVDWAGLATSKGSRFFWRQRIRLIAPAGFIRVMED